MNGELIWVLFTGDCRRVVCDGQSTYGCGGFIRHCCFVLSGTLTLPKPSPALAIRMSFLSPPYLLLATASCAPALRRWSVRLVKMAGSSEIKMLVLLMITVAGLGAFMSSTGVVAIFIPVVLSVSMHMQTSPSRLMMPLSFAGLISGMMTLAATPPNCG